MGSKYKYDHEIGETPPPGFYDPETGVNMTKPRNPSTFIKEDIGIKLQRDKNPEAGMYDPHKPFGSDMQNIDFGCKYEFIPDQNPSPGYYDPRDTQTKEKASSAIIPYERKKDPFKAARGQPGPGQYDGHLKEFGDIP